MSKHNHSSIAMKELFFSEDFSKLWRTYGENHNYTEVSPSFAESPDAGRLH